MRLALAHAGLDVSKVRIKSIKANSTVISLEGDGLEIQRLIDLLRHGGAVRDKFVSELGLTEIRWDAGRIVLQTAVQPREDFADKAQSRETANVRRIQNIRNVAFCGHGSAGKTTLIDMMLVKAGAVNATPSVDDETSICDFDQEEKDHKYTIEASVIHFEHLSLANTPSSLSVRDLRHRHFVGRSARMLHFLITLV